MTHKLKLTLIALVFGVLASNTIFADSLIKKVELIGNEAGGHSAFNSVTDTLRIKSAKLPKTSIIIDYEYGHQGSKTVQISPAIPLSSALNVELYRQHDGSINYADCSGSVTLSSGATQDQHIKDVHPGSGKHINDGHSIRLCNGTTVDYDADSGTITFSTPSEN